MSNNLVSQPLIIQNNQTDPIPNKLDAPMPAGMTGGSATVSPRVHQFDTSNKHIGAVQPMPGNFGYYNPLLSNNHISQKDVQMSGIGLPQFMMSNQGSPKLSLPIKRTAAGEHIIGNSSGQQWVTPDKNIAQLSPLNNKPVTQQQGSKSAPNKKMARNDSGSGRSGTKQVQAPKNQTIQMEPSPKNKAESFESVRSKMRESLASALAMVTKDEIVKSGNTADNSEKKENSAADEKALDGQITSQPIINSVEKKNINEPEFQYVTPALAGDEVPFSDSFFVQDELLQGNGLTWAMDLSLDIRETKEIETPKKPKLTQEDETKVENKETLPSPQILATTIEAELFKLFSGVNKKYKEKGRSLLFNLKDRNNPELRERVMSGEILPDQLCAMSAEELASKELSEWRIAKAEEHIKEVVLPDSEVDIRKLVRKTHKGEFQVEVEQDDGYSVEVSVGSNVVSRPKKENKKSEKNKNDGKYNVITIGNEVAEADFMQGLMVDEFKDPDFLPPIVSLDEFMQSLDTEPPFENLQVEGEKTDSPLEKEGSPVNGAKKEGLNEIVETSDKVEADVKMKTKEGSVEDKLSSKKVDVLTGERVWEGFLQLSVSGGVNAVGLFRSGEKTSTKEWPALVEIKGRVRLDAFEKFISDLPMSRTRAVMMAHFALKEGSSDADHASLGEAVYSYVSDERLGFAEPVPGSVEIYFCPPHPKIFEMLSKHLSKFNADILNTIEKGLIGVIVWRRPHITSNISPKSTSHHKHVSKKHHHSTSTTNISTTNVMSNNNMQNNNFVPHQRAPPVRPPPHQFNDEDEDDVPPGFGPPGFGPAPTRARDEDDLPEFNFSGGNLHKQNVSNARPVDQMRELVMKYGQTGINNLHNNNNVGNINSRVGMKKWNSDDEDDILPEWKPGQNLQQQRQSLVNLQGNNTVQGGGSWANQVPRGTQGQRHNSSANLGSQVYGAQRYPRTRGF